MGGWDDLINHRPLTAWMVMIGGSLLLGGGLGLLAELAGLLAFGIVVGVLIVGMFIVITR